ncbi:MAG: M20/M25/M40 family metallo-hydrolase [Gemmatimonadota bacterium]|nr:M20/M25/M40 family metallo-hydrolase [Gemmatimonadota bacterium]
MHVPSVAARLYRPSSMRLHRVLPVLLFVSPAVASSVAAQDVARLAGRPDVRATLDSIRARNAWTMDQQVALCEIPAPPFKEAARGAAYKAAFERLGLSNVRVDAVGNVIGERRGTGNGPTVVLAGHLDTVFPEGTDVMVKREGTRYTGRGIGDDCRGLTVVLSVARALQGSNIQTPGTIVFVGNVGEEGPGNLRGTRHLFATELAGKIDYFISVDGTGGDITSRAVGSNRYRVTYKGRGGHSYGAFGNPNPAHALGRAMAVIADFKVPTSPKTTFNVGVIKGGTSVNSIPFDASMEVDLRSESAASLAALDAKLQRALRNALAAENGRWPKATDKLSLAIDTVGIRPAGSQPDTVRIVRTAREAARALGWTPTLGTSSTDANVPIGLGLPGITIDGGGSGGGAHGLDEWYDDGAEGWKGPQWATLLVLALAGAR